MMRMTIPASESLPEYVDGLPNLCGSEDLIAEAMAGNEPVFMPQSAIDFDRVRSALDRCGGGDVYEGPFRLEGARVWRGSHS